MADKFCQHGLATGLNDGTSAANAWQVFEEVVENTMASGSYASADIIYVATHDGTSNITVSTTNEHKFAVIGDIDNPMRMVFDDGTKFASGGTFTFIGTNDTAKLFLRNFWEIEGNNRLEMSTNRTGYFSFLKGSGRISNLKMLLINVNQSQNIGAAGDGSTNRGKLIVENLTVEITGSNTNNRNLFNADSNGAQLLLINPIIDFTNHTSKAISTDYALFQAKSQDARIDVQGGEVTGATTVFKLFSALNGNTSVTGGNISIDGMKLPSIMTSVAAGFLKAPEPITSVSVSGTDHCYVKGGVQENDFVFGNSNGWVQWEQDGLYPTLNAKLPDSASGTSWSMKIYPKTASRYNPLSCPPVRKIYDQTAATKTLTFDFLTDDRQTVQDYDVWVDVMYTDDSTGDKVIESTRVDLAAAATLTTSTASWTGTTYATQSYDKRKISFTTANSIKQYTEVVAYLYVGVTSFDTNSFFFYDPDFDIA